MSMTPQERDALRIRGAAAMMHVTEAEAARRLDAAHGPGWRKAPLDKASAQSETEPEPKIEEKS